MDLLSANPSGDHLHRFLAGPVLPHIDQVPTARGNHSMPAKQHLMGKGHRCVAVQIDHHLRDALFGGRDAAPISNQAELTLHGGLYARPVEYLALNLKGRKRFSAHDFDEELIVLVLAQVLGSADDDACAKEELLFGSDHLKAVPSEVWPKRVLPVPCHER